MREFFLSRQSAGPIRSCLAACFVAFGVLALGGCAATNPFLPGSGPSESGVSEHAAQPNSPILLVDLSQDIVARALEAQRRVPLSQALGEPSAPALTIGAGDALEVSIWEAPPAALFSASPAEQRGLMGTSSRVSVLPDQPVSSAGTITVPFAGTVSVAGRTPQEVEQEIARRLKGKANDPQVLVRVLRNTSSTVTVVGEVRTSARFPLTATGERLLDAIAASGGVSQPVGKVTIRVTRQSMDQGRRTTRAAALPLDAIITDPVQNIVLQPGDVVTALYQPNSFTVLGATTRNEEVSFEAQGITLTQALARAGGLQDQRADPTAVYLFRFERPNLVGAAPAQRTTADGQIPVIYRINLKDPLSFFLAHDFPVRNKDILYVANAPAAELQKFVNLISGVVLPALAIHNTTN